jgi:hypothetical protein
MASRNKYRQWLASLVIIFRNPSIWPANGGGVQRRKRGGVAGQWRNIWRLISYRSCIVLSANLIRKLKLIINAENMSIGSARRML